MFLVTVTEDTYVKKRNTYNKDLLPGGGRHRCSSSFNAFVGVAQLTLSCQNPYNNIEKRTLLVSALQSAEKFLAKLRCNNCVRWESSQARTDRLGRSTSLGTTPKSGVFPASVVHVMSAGLEFTVLNYAAYKFNDCQPTVHMTFSSICPLIWLYIC